MGAYGTYTGIVRWFDPATQQGYLLSLLDGEIQASIIGEGITAANDNILLDASGLTLHDMTGASIITPAFGIGWVHDTLLNNEDFTAWTMGGTASVTGNTQTAPTGEGSTADTIDFPAAGDGVTQLAVASPTLADGQTAMLMVWLKAAAAGTIHIEGRAGAGGTVIGSDDVAVLTSWRRFAVLLTNNTGSACRVEAVIVRDGAGQLSSLYAWGAQCAYDVAIETPYYSFNPNGNKKWGVTIRSPLFITYETTGTVLIGNNWVTLPTAQYGVFVGGLAGDGASGTSPIGLGIRAGQNNSGDYGFMAGQDAGNGNTGDDVIILGRLAGYENTFDNVMIFGAGADATGANQFVAGSEDTIMTNVFFGKGVSNSAPTAYTINGTGGLGTDIAGAELQLAGGKGTGSGAGGSVVIQTAPAGASGSTLNALVDRITVAADGSIDFHNNTINNWAGPGGSGSVTRWRLMFGA